MTLELLQKKGSTVHYKKNQVVFMEDDIGYNMYIVLKGSFGVYVNSFSDFPIKIADITSGNFFGEMSVIDDSPRSATIIAKEDSLAIEITKEMFPLLIESNPDIAERILKTLLKRSETAKEKARALGKILPDFSGELAVTGLEDPTYRISNMLILAKQIRVLNHILMNKESEVELQKQDKDSTYIHLLPDDHTISNHYDTNDNKQFLYKKQAVCPLCFAQNEIYLPIFSRLEVQDKTLDQRIIYKDFDILWYTNCVCNNCNYTDAYQEFIKYRQAARKPIYKDNQFINVENFTGYEKEYNRSLDEVIKSYYLNIHCINKTTGNTLKLAKAWHKIYWIYKDNSYNLLMKKAAVNAMEYYTKYCKTNDKTIDTEKLMQVNMILGEISYDLKDTKEAIRYYKYNVELGRYIKNELHDQCLKKIAELKYSI